MYYFYQYGEKDIELHKNTEIPGVHERSVFIGNFPVIFSRDRSEYIIGEEYAGDGGLGEVFVVVGEHQEESGN